MLNFSIDPKTIASLPCYTCFQWKGGDSFSYLRFGNQHAFLPGRHFFLAREKAQQRICIPCGIRRGVYLYGAEIRRVHVCRSCGKYPAATRDEEADIKYLTKWISHYFPFCLDCLKRDDTPYTVEEYEHAKKWRRYEASMRAREQRRAEHAKVRLEQHASGSELEKLQPKGFGWRYCPVRNRFGLCDCYKRQVIR